MNVEFANNELRRRWERSDLAVRAWGPLVGRRYIERVGLIQEAVSLRDLQLLRSLRVHALKGEQQGLLTMVIHDRWRLVFSTPMAETVRIEDVSNHYGD